MAGPTPFFKLSGAGNDFIALVEPPAPPAAEQIRAWCRRGLSQGADGVFVIDRTPDGARMRHWNPDGGRSTLCLNGSRCAAHLAFHLGWAKDELALGTDAGTLGAWRTGDEQVRVTLPDLVERLAPRCLEADGQRYEGYSVDVGVPHFVLPWEGPLATAPLIEIGPLLRAHPDLGEAGANVDLVRHVAAGHLELRTWERGVEGETLACGTGVVAAAAVALASKRGRLPLVALTAGGYELAVEGDDRPRSLEGDARLVARGDLLVGAAVVPTAPAWST